MPAPENEPPAVDEIDRISVCICTFRRPTLLARLLEALAVQVVDKEFAFDVVVVDNDRARSAHDIVAEFSARTRVSVHYDCEPEQNIALARNRAVRGATGNLIACIDDDEWPIREWLARLYRALANSTADGVLGPVIPDLPPGAPSWLKRGTFLERRRHETGTAITAHDARTGNVLLRRACFVDRDIWFDPALGRSGGEDGVFFANQMRRGATYIWCDEALVYEAVPPERWKGSYYVKRWLVSGTVTGERLRSGAVPSRRIVGANVLLCIGCSLLTLPAMLLPKHVWLRLATKATYSAGLVTAYYGYSMMRHRY